MRKTIFAALASTGLLLGTGATADAGLLTPLVAGPGDALRVTLVRQGCGFGGHRGFYGGCRANFGPRGRVFAYRHYGYGRPFYRPYRRPYGYRPYY